MQPDPQDMLDEDLVKPEEQKLPCSKEKWYNFAKSKARWTQKCRETAIIDEDALLDDFQTQITFNGFHHLLGAHVEEQNVFLKKRLKL